MEDNTAAEAVGTVVCAWAGLGCVPGLVSTTKSAKPTTKAISIATHVPFFLAALLSMRHHLPVEGRRKGVSDPRPG
jgi:hypothetical protein